MSIPASRRIWLWQNIFSPHMAGLAVALARQGCEVTYVAEQAMSDDRVQQGWNLPLLDGVALKLMATPKAVDEMVASAPPDCIHICSGVRGNGMVGVVQRAIARHGLRQWVMMETVDDSGWRGKLRRLAYQHLFRRSRPYLQGVLAIGHSMPEWVAARGVSSGLVFPFAYFLPETDLASARIQRAPGPFRFIFAGRLIPLKRVDWLMAELANLTNQTPELWIVGAGPEETVLRTLAGKRLGDRVRWLGQLPLKKVPAVLAQADCLVLPSVHDGWGAVVSEALMVGTPVICSDACGSAGVVRASGFGGVFGGAYHASLSNLLEQVLANGPLPSGEKAALAEWAACLGGRAGAAYLLQVLDHVDGRVSRPLPPWEIGMTAGNLSMRNA
jgi:glycosyltransferase involved in cell wall biosynthesis